MILNTSRASPGRRKYNPFVEERSVTPVDFMPPDVVLKPAAPPASRLCFKVGDSFVLC